MRRCIAIGALLVLGISPLLLQCRDEPQYGEQVGETGQLTLPLEAFGRSGNRYRLRDAIFLVERRVDAEGVGGDAGEVGSTSSTIGAGGSAPFGGDAGSGGSLANGGASDSGGASGSGGGFANGGNGAAGSGGGSSANGGAGGGSGAAGSGFASASITSASGFGMASTTTGGFGVGGGSSGDFELERVLFSEDALFDPEIIARLRTGEYRITLADGWIMERITPDGDSAFVQADLLSSPIQFFEIFSREVSFVFYSFLVDGNQIIFGREGDLVVGIEVEEVGGSFNRRSVFETSELALSQFSLEETLDALGTNAGFEANGQQLYQQLIDSYASAPGRLENAVHCGDENPNGPPTLNGYPIECDRLETQQFDNLDSWFPVAVVNRLDLAPENGAHCGQQRLIFANNEPIGNGRMFIIVEALLPNPDPELGIQACVPVAAFWRSLEDVDDPVLRGELLREAFLGAGLPGFGPFMSAPNLTAGTGQIRTNNFNHFIWTLREFKLVQQDAEVGVVPFPVAESPHGPLWNDSLDFPFGDACRSSFLEAIEGVLTDNPAEMAFIVDHECKNAESQNDFFTEDYALHLSEGNADGFLVELEERLEGTGLSPFDIAARARFAGSCIGCHEEAVGSFLGNGVSAPFSNGFTHITEFFLEDCGDGTGCFGISQALRDVFLPHRAAVLDELLGDGGGVGGAGGASGSDGFGGADGSGGATFSSTTGASMTTGSGGAAAELPSSELDVEELMEVDEQAKDAWGTRTLGGQPARVTH